jgi:hypothetical protein
MGYFDVWHGNEGIPYYPKKKKSMSLAGTAFQKKTTAKAGKISILSPNKPNL